MLGVQSLDLSKSYNIEDTYQTWKRKFNNALHKCFRKKRVGNTGPVYYNEIRTPIQERKKLTSKLAVSF